MGNVYSGRRAWRILVDECVVLDVGGLSTIFEVPAGEGWLELRSRRSQSIWYEFTVRGDVVAAQLKLTPTDSRTGAPSTILIDGQRQRFGGVRPFLICPDDSGAVISATLVDANPNLPILVDAPPVNELAF